MADYKEQRAAFVKYRAYLLSAVLGLTLVIFVLLAAGNNSPIPNQVTKSVNFKLFYPKDLPRGYSYEKSSTKSEGGLVFLSVISGAKKITITEQVRPNPPPDLIALTKPQKAQLPPGTAGVAAPTLAPSFKEIDCPIGQAIIGTNISNAPTAIVLTDTTLINITSTSTLTDTAIREIVADLE
jgi:hypothetical protein